MGPGAEREGGARRGRGSVLLAAGLGGFAGMSVELAAVRLLAPHFGASVFVWTNVIGVVLGSLAAGTFAGGHAADRYPARSVLRGTLLVAGLLCAAAPFLARPLGGFFVPPGSGLRLEDALPVLAGGSLAASVLLFAPPLFFLGALTPAAVRAIASDAGSIGRAAGAVFAVSTLGSLAGTFATTHLLVPLAGVRNTFFVCAGLLLLASVLVAPPRARGPGLGVLLLAPAASFLGGKGPPRPPAPGEERLCHRDTPYQFVEIVRSGGTRRLRVNEGLDSFQSLLVEGSPWTGAYYDLFALAPLLAERRSEEPLRVLVLGLGGGTVSRLFHDLYGENRDLRIVGVELDPGLIEASRESFDLTSEKHPRLRILSGLDGRVALEVLEEVFDVVVLDAYASQIHIPPHLASLEAFEAVRSRLSPGGVLAVNVGGFGFDDPVVSAIGATLAAAFGEAEGVRVRDARNLVLFARAGGALDWDRARRTAEEPRLRALAAYAAASPVRRAFHASPREALLRDDSPRLDFLQVSSLWRAALRR